MQNSTNPRLATALDYAAAGLSVIPVHGLREDGSCTCGNPNCDSPGKHPVGKWKAAQQAPLSADELRRRFGDNPDFNVGIVTGKVSNLVVIDVDDTNVAQSFAERVCQVTSEMPRVSRTRRGVHFLFAAPNHPTKNAAGIEPHIDIRAEGGFIVAPPSRHPDGEYSWKSDVAFDALPQAPGFVQDWTRQDRSVAKNGNQKANLPQQFTQNEGADQYGAKALEEECEKIRAAAIGCQEETFNRSALKIGALVKGGEMQSAHARSALLSAGLDMANDPSRPNWTADCLETKIDHAFRDATARQRTPKNVNSRSEFADIDLTLADTLGHRTPKFPVDALPDAWQQWCASTADRCGGSVDYVGLSLISLAAGLIGTKRYAQAWPGWREPVILWGALVGKPGANKSAPLSVVRGAIDKIEDDLLREHQAKMMKYHREMLVFQEENQRWIDAVKKDPDADFAKPEAPQKPVQPRAIVTDVTVEKLAHLLSDHPEGLVLVRDELAGWIGNFNKYGKGDGDVAFYLECKDGKPYTVDRVKDGTDNSLRVPSCALSIIGTIQPDRLAPLIERANDGFVPRFLFAWPEPQRWSGPPKEAAMNFSSLHADAFKRLFMLTCPKGESRNVSLDTEAKAEFSAFFGRNEDKTFKADGLFASFLAKGQGTVLRLALLLELLGWAASRKDEPSTITAASVCAAVQLFEDYFTPMALKTFGEANLPQAHRGARSAARYIRDKQVCEFSKRQMYNDWQIVRTAADADAVLVELQRAGWTMPVETQTQQRGRPSEKWIVNPAVQSNQG